MDNLIQVTNKIFFEELGLWEEKGVVGNVTLTIEDDGVIYAFVKDITGIDDRELWTTIGAE